MDLTIVIALITGLLIGATACLAVFRWRSTNRKRSARPSTSSLHGIFSLTGEFPLYLTPLIQTLRDSGYTLEYRFTEGKPSPDSVDEEYQFSGILIASNPKTLMTQGLLLTPVGYRFIGSFEYL